MLSNKLTFSLASLIVLLMVAFCFPVAAQVGGLASLDPSAALTIPAGKHGVLGIAPTADPEDAGIVDGTSYRQAPPPTTTGLTDLPDFAAFFAIGGTLELMITSYDGSADPATAINLDPDGTRNVTARDLVISEIMWGRDESGFAADGTTAIPADSKQWIEIFNTTAFDITIGATAASDTGTTPAVVTARLQVTYHTTVTEKPPANYIVSDTVSNVSFGGKWTMPGSSGVTASPVNKPTAPPQSNLVSAYRNINYNAVRGTHLSAIKIDGMVDEKIKRDKQIEQFMPGKDADGTLAKGWKETPVEGSRNMMRWYIGSPGMDHISDKDFTFDIAPTSVPSNSVVINEIRSDTSAANVDWVELYNAGSEAVGLWDWELTAITGDDLSKTDTYLVGWDKPETTREQTSFPKNDEWKLQPKEYLLIVNRDPRETQLANGVDVDAVIAGKEVKAGATHQYIIRPKLQLPSSNFTLILRNAIDKNVRHEDPRKEEHADARVDDNVAPSEKIMDFAGNYGKEVDSSEYNTKFFPLRGWNRLAGTTGKDGENIKIGAAHSFSRKRYQANDGHHKDAWEPVGHKGGVGYDRGTDLTISPGTPGYANDSMRTKLFDDKNNADASDDVTYNGRVSISEIMYDAGERWNLIQWIELYNSSMDETLNLKGWRIEIRNADDDVGSYVDGGFTFNDAYILPNQTLLIVSGTGTNDVAANRVYNLYQHHRRALGLTNRRSVLLSSTGFNIKLWDKDADITRDDPVDEVGNYDIPAVVPVLQEGMRDELWSLDMFPRDPNMRQSLVRQYGSRELYDGTPDMPDDGLMMESWRQSELTGAGISFYGHRDDVSTPGFRLGGPLPVTLSKFRPVRNQETGHVDITWITQSELNNAGFNILRSEAKTGEFKVINVKGIIAGHGTTSEKHVYTFTDTTAKPNVVYYYQIEDVSINGLRTTLTTTHLRGHVGAAGKLTTRWGELKSSGK